MDDRLTALLADVADERLFAWTSPEVGGGVEGLVEKVVGMSPIDELGIVVLGRRAID